MKVRVLQDVSGTVFNDPNGLRRGQLVDWPDEIALRYMHHHLVEHPDTADQSPEERKAWADKAHAAMLAFALPHLEEIKKVQEEAHRANVRATTADAKRRRGGWH
ncbi:hypothetical protein BN971_03246 [Mycobacterium bohemicum DSM 44277]|uniref:Uncharacterized protein n=1 Tax=Mycobacterium bohemicum DSM 44277 TaxID=1236609 RepID=A0A0U0WAV1_MYCBE|nr:hypothetical protein [Mycobacterium bohemicum]MCV6968175.1 hypothetical protein [Mycobacterium bohemicum]CPR11953.1 hypothetical protein BN971_03246 [Mycobacterium bohemicum DSM 44277]